MALRKLLLCLLVLAAATSARAAIVFSDDYELRPDNQDIWGTLPTTSTPGVGTYGFVLTFPFSGKIDPFTPLGKLLKFDTSTGDDTQMAFVPYSYLFSDERVLLTLRAAHPANQPGFNNFAIGFAAFSAGDGHMIFTDHILVQENQIQLNFPGADIVTSTIPFASTVNSFYEFELGYDPNLAGIAGSQPYTLAINGTEVPLPVGPTTLYTPLAGFDAVSFGGRFSGGLTTRFISDFAFETFQVSQIPAPGSLALVGLAIAALGWRRRSNGLST